MRRLPHAVAEHREKRDRLMHRQYAIGSGGSTAFAHRSSAPSSLRRATHPGRPSHARCERWPTRPKTFQWPMLAGGCLMRRQRAAWRRPMTTFVHRSLRATAPPTPRRPRLDRSVDVDARRLPHLNLPSLPCPLAGPCDPGNPCLARKRLAGGRIPRIAWTGKHSLYGRQGVKKGLFDLVGPALGRSLERPGSARAVRAIRHRRLYEKSGVSQSASSRLAHPKLFPVRREADQEAGAAARGRGGFRHAALISSEPVRSRRHRRRGRGHLESLSRPCGVGPPPDRMASGRGVCRASTSWAKTWLRPCDAHVRRQDAERWNSGKPSARSWISAMAG